jgi:hypothetical protein
MARQREKTKAAATIKVVLDVKPGRVSAAQEQAWKHLWQRLIAETKREVGNGR